MSQTVQFKRIGGGRRGRARGGGLGAVKLNRWRTGTNLGLCGTGAKLFHPGAAVKRRVGRLLKRRHGVKAGKVLPMTRGGKDRRRARGLAKKKAGEDG